MLQSVWLAVVQVQSIWQLLHGVISTPCHQFVGNEEFLLGNVDTGIVNEEIRNEFKLCNVYAKESCKDCFARFYCSGGCSANSYNFSGSINGAYEIGCEMQKKRIECAIMIKAALADEE